jgi:type IX secretion system PorP/SprF family membrane protein
MKNILLIVFVCVGFSVVGQQRPIQSLYMFDNFLINPAYAGNQVQLSATAIYRNQWVNLEGAPQTATASVHSGFLKNKMGLGVIIANDQIGIHNDFSFYGAYSYKINFPNNVQLSMGLQAGFNNLVSDFNKLNNKNPNDPNLSGVNGKFNPNFGTGLFLSYRGGYFGFSIPYLLNNEIIDFEGVFSSARQRRNYYLTAGRTINVAKDFKVIPSALIRVQEQGPLSFDINTNFVFYDAIGLGISYRLNDSVVGMFELKINENFHAGYAYDITNSALNNFSNGTHEIMVNYRIRIPKLHKGLECPSYF